MTSASLRTSSGAPCLITRPTFERRHAVADAEHEVGVVLDEEHADAAVAQRPDDVAEVLDLVAGEAAGRLVEQDEARPHRQAAGDLEEALLGMREQVGAPAAGRGRGRRRAAARPRVRAARGPRGRPRAGRRRWRGSPRAHGATRRAWRCRAPAASAAGAASGRCGRCRGASGAAPSRSTGLRRRAGSPPLFGW